MKNSIHFMGIGGSGCSGVASIAFSLGYKVSGCDLADSPYTDYLIKNKVNISTEHNPNHLTDIDCLVLSPAVTSLDRDNPEVLEAKKRGIEVLTWQEFLGRELTSNKFVICVAGTHGKSTTTALIGLFLEKAGFDPIVLVGAIVKEWFGNFRVGRGKYFVIEGDEYNNNFLNYHPDLGVITNIEFDHPEFFKNEEEFKQAFQNFVLSFKDNSVLFKGEKVDLTNKKGATKEAKMQKLDLKIPGFFNQKNASLAIAVAQYLGVKPESIAEVLHQFTGVKRRFELVFDEKGVKIFNDYAHHPTAIKATLQTARELFPKNRIWAIFQPHMFSRTKTFFKDFVKDFKVAEVDKIVITDIFPSREKDTGLVSSQDLVAAIGEKALYSGKIEETVNYLLNNLESGDVVIVMGAGDIDRLATELGRKFKENELS